MLYLHPSTLQMCLLAFEADMEKAFAAQLSQDKVGRVALRSSSLVFFFFFFGDALSLNFVSSSPLFWLPGVLHLYGGGGSEGEPVGPQVRHPVLLLSHLLPGLHPQVALHQDLQQQDHQVSLRTRPGGVSTRLSGYVHMTLERSKSSL